MSRIIIFESGIIRVIKLASFESDGNSFPSEMHLSLSIRFSVRKSPDALTGSSKSICKRKCARSSYRRRWHHVQACVAIAMEPQIMTTRSMETVNTANTISIKNIIPWRRLIRFQLKTHSTT